MNGWRVVNISIPGAVVQPMGCHVVVISVEKRVDATAADPIRRCMLSDDVMLIAT